MKPKTTAVMRNIIRQVRENFPFAMSEEELCAETCSHGCSIKLLEYMDQEITEWEQRLDNGEVPNLGDIQKLSKSSQKIYKVLEKNNLVNKADKATSIPASSSGYGMLKSRRKAVPADFDPANLLEN